MWHTNPKFDVLKRSRPIVQTKGENLVVRLPGGKFRGRTKALKASQVYPVAFAKAVTDVSRVRACTAHREAYGDNTRFTLGE